MCIEESKKKILLSLTSVYWGEPSARLLCAAHSRSPFVRLIFLWWIIDALWIEVRTVAYEMLPR